MNIAYDIDKYDCQVNPLKTLIQMKVLEYDI